MSKRIIPIIASLFVISMTACTKANKGNCMDCTGCFGSWTECESDWQHDSITWQEHEDYMINNPENGTWACEKQE